MNITRLNYTKMQIVPLKIIIFSTFSKKIIFCKNPDTFSMLSVLEISHKFFPHKRSPYARNNFSTNKQCIFNTKSQVMLCIKMNVFTKNHAKFLYQFSRNVVHKHKYKKLRKSHSKISNTFYVCNMIEL